MMAPSLPRAATPPEFRGDFDGDGFAVVPGLFDPDEVAAIAGEIDDLFDGPAGLPSGHAYDLGGGPAARIPAIRDVLKLRPGLRASAGLGRAIAAASRLIGPGAEVLWDAAVYKPPGASTETPWHQDEAVYDLAKIRKPRAIVYFWVALEPVGAGAGCMRFLPGSHLGPIRPHGWRGGDRTSSLEVIGPVDDAAGVSVPLGAGDATVHHARALHGSGPNASGSCRKGWVLGIGRPAAPRWLRLAKRGVLAAIGRSTVGR